jgi:hypothetical protein
MKRNLISEILKAEWQICHVFGIVAGELSQPLQALRSAHLIDLTQHIPIFAQKFRQLSRGCAQFLSGVGHAPSCVRQHVQNDSDGQREILGSRRCLKVWLWVRFPALADLQG